MLKFIIADKNQLCDNCFAVHLERGWVDEISRMYKIFVFSIVHET